MNAKITEKTKTHVTVEVKVPLGNSMLKFEEELQKGLNEAGCLATGEGLNQFETDGSPMMTGDIKWTARSQKRPKEYETPYGKARVERYVYQTSKGGRTRCPLEEKANIIHTATPRFAKILSSKYTEFGAAGVQDDLESNHGRKIRKAYIQDIAELVGMVVDAKEETWEYDLPEIDAQITTITSSLDGTCMLMKDDGWREAMTGAISLYDDQGVRRYTIYTAASPEYGKKKFLEKLEREIERIQNKFPRAKNVGLADGAKENWKFLEPFTEIQVLDFFHASEYVGNVGEAVFKDKDKRKEWITTSCHNLKHEDDAAKNLYKEFLIFEKEQKLPTVAKDKLSAAISYFKNNMGRMNYAQNRKDNIPIGSGVIEAACKVIIKQRLCQSGMRWKDAGASIVLSLRTLKRSSGRWEQFWSKIDQFGYCFS